MKLRQLRYFVALAEELHFGRAAQRLSITQPPLSTNIQKLEEDLGVQLVDRTRKRVTLTQAGAGFLQEARRVLIQADRAYEVARSLADGRSGFLDVGITGSMLFRGVPNVVSNFIAQNPGVEILLREQSTIEQIDALKGGRLDLGFINFGFLPDGLVGEKLPEECFVCCLPDTHPLAHNQDVALHELSNDQFVMFVRELSPYNYDNILAVCARSGFYPKMRFAARQWLTVAAMVANGLGVALVPKSVSQSKLAGARFLPIRGPMTVSTAWCVRRHDNVNPTALAFIEDVRRLTSTTEDTVESNT
ncbi:LysR family transcriptional regulator [Alcaligenaceae bacterium CGII-47]|nr:LysR family transcriptional regulator [Alcaligenaceae bacterium CGII-47]